MDERSTGARTGKTTDLVRFTSVSKVYGKNGNAGAALHDVSLCLPEGTYTAVMGPSGSGKSTFLHCAAGLDLPTSGSVHLAGLSLGDLDEDALSRLRRERVGFVFQSFNLVPSLSAADNIVLPLRLGGVKPDKAWLDEIRVHAAVRRQSIAVFVLLGVVVLVSAVAAVNALSTAIAERACELELLRLIGATRRQLTRMIRLEVSLTVAFATTVGALTAAPGVAVFSYGKTGSFVPALPVWISVGLPASAALLAFAASVVPMRRALRAGRGSLTSGAA